MTSRFSPAFRLLAAANLGAQSAEQLSLAAAPLVAVLALDAGAGEVGLLGAMQTLPFLLLSIPMGLLTDRMPRRRVMLASEALRALSLLLLLLIVASGRISFAALAVLGFIGALGTVGFTVAAPALVPALVPRELHARANGRLELARSAAYAGGPALAGALVAWTGAASAFVLATLLSASAVALLWRVAEPPRAPAPARHALIEIREGARFVWHDALLRPILLTGIAWNIAWFVLQAAYVPYAVRVLGLSAQAVGVTLGCYGAGMVVGALAAPPVVRSLAFGRAIQLGPAVSVLAMSAMVATLLVPSGVLAGLSFFLFGAGPIIWTITTTTLRQAITPGAMLGRVGSVFLTVNAGARPVGAAIGAVVGGLWGEPACLWLALAGFVLQAAIILASSMNGLQRLPALRTG
ncbi:MFS transporter [Ramlibacter sp. AN1133]|uniref:MFS transporter n=1 Tax=Ramlibacter sp. AN1133 TaxID=3133429 RepID=UPI0030BE5A22